MSQFNRGKSTWKPIRQMVEEVKSQYGSIDNAIAANLKKLGIDYSKVERLHQEGTTLVVTMKSGEVIRL